MWPQLTEVRSIGIMKKSSSNIDMSRALENTDMAGAIEDAMRLAQPPTLTSDLMAKIKSLPAEKDRAFLVFKAEKEQLGHARMVKIYEEAGLAM